MENSEVFAFFAETTTHRKMMKMNQLSLAIALTPKQVKPIETLGFSVSVSATQKMVIRICQNLSRNPISCLHNLFEWRHPHTAGPVEYSFGYATTSSALPHKMPVLPKKARSSGEPRDFVDYKRVICKAGFGGHGLISFLREKNLEFGGADGGNGGNGGHVIFKADSKICDLSHVNFYIRAQNGIKGQGKCCHGKNGEHLYVPVPLNTLIKKPSTDQFRPSKDVIWELTQEGEMFIAARGGAGGHGNAFYLSNMVRKPLKAEEGGLGEKIRYDIEMRVMATAGLVGFPNVGKSTLLRAISRAKPKVAAYPFTTLKPSVGMVQYADCFQLAVADIPGLVEGAHLNEGLGFSFLRHVVRCECVLFVLDHTQGNLVEQLTSLKSELALYDGELRDKESAIVLNKVDTAEDQAKMARSVAEMFPGERVFIISGKYRSNLEPMLLYLRERQEQFLKQRKAEAEQRELTMMIGPTTA